MSGKIKLMEQGQGQYDFYILSDEIDSAASLRASAEATQPSIKSVAAKMEEYAAEITGIHPAKILSALQKHPEGIPVIPPNQRQRQH